MTTEPGPPLYLTTEGEDDHGHNGAPPLATGAASGRDELWRLPARVQHRLGQGRDPLAGLPDACRWLAQALLVDVALVLTQGAVVERVVAWPPGSQHGERLASLTGRGIEDQPTLLSALRGRRTVHHPIVSPGSVPSEPGELASEVRSVGVVPLLGGDLEVGALVAHSPAPAGVGPTTVGVLEDVARPLALALANARLRKALSDLEGAQEAARVREELLAALSHDMQTPLAVLLGSIKALQAVDDLAPKQRAALYESMARRGAQLHRLVEQFLDYSRLEAGRPIEVRPSVTDVAAAIHRVETDIGWRRPLHVRVPDDLPPAFVDPDRLDQVLANLVSNALKFSPVDSPIFVQAAASDDSVSITVIDRGRGMTPDELEQAFVKFQRGSGARGTRGTGLGLYVSRAVIEAQGGRLEAESEPGEGSRFTVVLPLHPALAPAQAGEPQP